jgi:uncharacterized membrane protein YeaQ/YmgE (transglycosylase-associated protein family)
MGFLSWIVMGLIVGVLAKVLMPGKDGGGFIKTSALGIGGAFLGGYIGTAVGFGAVNGFNLQSIGLATAGAMLLLVVFRKFG